MEADFSVHDDAETVRDDEQELDPDPDNDPRF
jgi:hypothetical protein